MRNEPVIEGLCSVVPHLAQRLHHRGNLHETRHIAAGTDGNYEVGNLDAEYVEIVFVKPRSVLDNPLLPFDESDNHIYRLFHANAAYAEKLGDVDNADTAAFHIAPV